MKRYRGESASEKGYSVAWPSAAVDSYRSQADAKLGERAFASDGTLPQYASDESIALIRYPCPASADLHAEPVAGAAAIAAAVVCAFARAVSSAVRAAALAVAAGVG